MNINSEEYPFCQLNETINLSPDNKVLSKSLMINLRNESPEVVYKNYLKLKQLIDNKEDKQEKEVKNVKKETQKAEKQNKKDNPGVCPKCGSSLIEKQGISKKTFRPYHFLSCSSWPACDFSKPFLTKKEKNVPCDEDMIPVESIPF